MSKPQQGRRYCRVRALQSPPSRGVVSFRQAEWCHFVTRAWRGIMDSSTTLGVCTVRVMHVVSGGGRGHSSGGREVQTQEPHGLLSAAQEAVRREQYNPPGA